MLDPLYALLYGLIQGLTEFLPISSSAHLALIPYFMELKDLGVTFDLLMHLGTEGAVILLYRKKIISYFFLLPSLMRTSKNSDEQELKGFLLATFCSAALAFTLKSFALEHARAPLWIASNLMIFGLLLSFFDYRKRSSKELKDQSLLGFYLWLGLFQALAIFPGVSRSGITMTFCRAKGLSRRDAGNFSFLLSLPLIIGGFILMLPDFFQQTDRPSLTICLIGLLSSFLFCVLAIKFFLRITQNVGFIWFTIYRLILGCIIIYSSLMIG